MRHLLSAPRQPKNVDSAAKEATAQDEPHSPLLRPSWPPGPSRLPRFHRELLGDGARAGPTPLLALPTNGLEGQREGTPTLLPFDGT